MKKIFPILFGALTGFLIAIITIHYLSYFNDSILLWYGTIMIFIFLSYFISTIIHELGHLVFGLFTGYKFLSIRFGSIMIILNHQQLKIKRFTLAGTGGQCLMDPPDLMNTHLPVILYNMGGCLFNIIFSLIFALLSYYCSYWVLSMLFDTIVIMNIISALTNGIPMKTNEICNDGYNTIHLYKDEEARLAFYKQLKISAYNHYGIRLKDMDENLFTYRIDQLDNPLWQAIAVMKANRELDAHHFEQCKTIIHSLLERCPSIIGLYKHLLINDLIYISIINNEDPSLLLTKEHKKMREVMKNMLPIIRTNYAYYLYINDINKANKAYELFCKTIQTYPYQSDIISEKELMENSYEQKRND